jgi:hypothetical protein
MAVLAMKMTALQENSEAIAWSIHIANGVYFIDKAL